MVAIMLGQSPARAAPPSLSAIQVEELKAEISNAKQRKVQPAEQVRELVKKSHNLKSNRPMNAAATDEANKVITRLEEAGLLNDAVYISNVLKEENVGRIIGTSEPDAHHPDCVAVGSSVSRFCCSGTLIAPQVVVSAGHCSGNCASYVLLGESVNAEERRIIKVRSRHLHPEYEVVGKTIRNDLTVLILDAAVETVAPRLIATTYEVENAREAWIVGFGTTDPAGAAGYGTRLVAGPAFFVDAANPTYGAIASIEVVLGKHPEGIDSCNGDSGGPIYIKTPNGEYVAASTSRPVKGSRTACGDGGIYVRLDKFLPWISSVCVSEGIAPPAAR